MNSLPLKSAAAALWAWVLKRWLYVIAACVFLFLVVGSLGVFKTQETKQVAEERATLTARQINGKDRFIAQIKDSIRVRDSLITKVIYVRDSLKVAADHHEAKADSLIKTIAHENAATDPDATPAAVERFLTNYAPRAYALPGGLDSLK